MSRDLRIFLKRSPVNGVLGPGARAVVWVQGCPLRCEGCISPESWDPAGGEPTNVRDLAEWVLAQNGIEGMTFSGGEPMMQAEAVAEVIRLVRGGTDAGVVCYTGFTIERLRASGSGEQTALLDLIDLLIDGPYVRELHGDLLWRSSSNQRLIFLTERYRSRVQALLRDGDRSAGLEITVETGGAVVAGVPPLPEMGEQMRHTASQRLPPGRG